MATPTTPSKQQIFGVLGDNTTESLLKQIDSKLSGLSQLAGVLTALQEVVSALGNSAVSLTGIRTVNQESEVKLTEILSSINVQVVSLSSVTESLATLQSQVNLLHEDNIDTGIKIDLLHADNLVVEGKLDGVRADTQEFKASFDSVKQATGGREVIRVQQDELGVLSKILERLDGIGMQLAIITEEETNV